MKFSLATIIVCAAIANAAAFPAPEAAVGDPNAVIAPSVETHFSGQFDATGALVAKEDNETDQALQKRIAPVVVVAGIAAIKGIAILTKIAVEIGQQTIANLGKWNETREKFTQATTLAMWNRNPDYNKFPAVACYNKGYHLRNPSGQDGRVSAKLSLGMLNTDYDCLYMTGNNAFYTHNEGGYINLSYRYNGGRCTFDKRTGDLTCR
ncbi:hypothetical protein SS1G_14379 [Sclerotinia sclerotiorum 1980 UF-70]|uniref:DUF7888 domain-containing protein n=2 Tax=Sclerotinia sclerotiorum (strain ATCC 18683 / 1980 / Ss-1) TaxID=665079 RepID=A0A1D9QN49_SCLS1|nr:hypothetical protein SS1G_14379 [Sclerotinia sclerotiorum 1980 UF-70]APA14930.1 hypothetical protein sscle_13g097000 [Sclerotinia sclerotiorum 1980 UF-70]APA16360.1 hypothetical protein sscle_16g111300 [Sclerotinia sclerotiorum 1980 UF-70]EDO00509.1 hypothetical protein SS1G_14379 [Sclerotinia sclerotiorum 1980 UF-70]